MGIIYTLPVRVMQVGVLQNLSYIVLIMRVVLHYSGILLTRHYWLEIAMVNLCLSYYCKLIKMHLIHSYYPTLFLRAMLLFRCIRIKSKYCEIIAVCNNTLLTVSLLNLKIVGRAEHGIQHHLHVRYGSQIAAGC